jgi:hypothetical protein
LSAASGAHFSGKAGPTAAKLRIQMGSHDVRQLGMRPTEVVVELSVNAREDLLSRVDLVIQMEKTGVGVPSVEMIQELFPGLISMCDLRIYIERVMYFREFLR